MEATSVEAPVLGIGREAVLALSQRQNEPEWLTERRLTSWGVFERTPMPTMQDEAWRRTDIRRLRLEAFRIPTESRPVFRSELSSDPRAGWLEVVDGFVASMSLDRGLVDQGVILGSLSGVAAQHPHLVQQHFAGLATDELGKFSALSNALGNGAVVYVPADVQVELPIEVNVTLTSGGAAVFPRTLVIAERHASVTVIERYYSPEFPEAALSVAGAEVYANDGAQVRYVAIQEWGRSVWHFLTQKHQVGRDSQENSLNIGLGSKLSRCEIGAAVVKSGASCEILGLYFADGDQHFDFHTLQDHVAPHCTSDLLYKGGLSGKGRTVFSGLIKVRPDAQRTDAYQTNRNLILSDGARADSIPNLEIEANDVRCSHGASVGPIDRDQLFYLMARGLNRRDAERMIVDGFFEPLVSRIPLEGVRERLQAAIDAKMD